MDFRVERLRKIRSLPSPEDGLRAIVDRAPEAEVALDRLNRRLRPIVELLYQLRRRIATATVAVLTVWLFLHVMFSENGMVVYKQKKTEIEVLQKQVDTLQKENGTYTQQIKALKTDPSAIEKEAREQLHYARPGEVIYVSPPAPPAPAKVANGPIKNRN